jgi:hypothetical protein
MWKKIQYRTSLQREKTMMFTRYSDPSHGWLEVPKSELKKLGIVDQISEYSYVSQSNFYLEEDRDAPIFMKEYKKFYNDRPMYEEIFSENCFIRGLRHVKEIEA